ncbi:helix-turn-helix domain-containing protein [Leisingera sp.]|uniref:helix-turn-helix domain-containing protein n=1 Tax=Leisingera sp. TaxID=1879318 RepID=UPI002B274B32|nr:helix-turn-helix domain-containing protein [Leisingera sp.]
MRSKEILEVVCEYYGLGQSELISPDKTRRVSWPRQMAMALMRRRTNLSTPQMAEALGLQCHTSVVYGLKAVKARCKRFPHFRADFDEMNRRLTGADFVRHEHAHGRPFSTARVGRG